jgi:hypothetical protein
MEMVEVIMEMFVSKMLMAPPPAAAQSMTAIPAALGKMPTTHRTSKVRATHRAGKV